MPFKVQFIQHVQYTPTISTHASVFYWNVSFVYLHKLKKKGYDTDWIGFVSKKVQETVLILTHVFWDSIVKLK